MEKPRSLRDEALECGPISFPPIDQARSEGMREVAKARFLH